MTQPAAPASAPAPIRPSAPDGSPPAIYLDASGTVRRHLDAGALADAVAHASRGEGTLWVDVNSGDERERATLADVFHFHPLAIDDALTPETRVKVEEYPEFMLVVLRVVRFRADTPDDPYDTETINLSLFVGHNFLVSVHSEPAPSVDAVVALVQKNPDLLKRGPARLAHLIADDAIDAFFPILDQVDEFVDGLEDRVFTSYDRDALQEIFRVKRLVLSLRRYLAPQRDVFNTLSNRPSPFLAPPDQLYFRDVYDHVLRLNDSIDTYRDLLSGTLDAYLSQVSNRLGQITKGLSVVATLSLPFVVISGMWGMNVEHIPLSHEPHAFALMVLVQLGIGAALVALLRWRALL